MKNKVMETFLIILVIMLLGLVGFGAYYINSIDKNGGVSSMIDSIGSNNTIEKNITNLTRYNSNELGFIKEIDELIMNLDISKKSKRNYLRIKINFELRSEEDVNMFEDFEAVIFDKILSISSSKTKEELMSIGGKDDLKDDLKSNINRSLPSNIIKNIYFREFVIQ